ncbi:MAG: 30S ribosomal protein S16 [Candidatus Gribaldobacteria bacterium]|nr:30S ribosomal protein S16 [Candidatus Gribaldobacteria bacterium]
MLAIRYIRTGKTNQPFFRLLVTDKRNPPRAGRFIEILGFVNPKTKERNLKADRIQYWLSVGAQASDTVHNLLIREKVIEGKKIPVHKKSKKEPETQATPVVKPVETKVVEAKATEETPVEPEAKTEA